MPRMGSVLPWLQAQGIKFSDSFQRKATKPNHFHCCVYRKYCCCSDDDFIQGVTYCNKLSCMLA